MAVGLSLTISELQNPVHRVTLPAARRGWEGFGPCLIFLGFVFSSFRSHRSAGLLEESVESDVLVAALVYSY